MTEAVNQPVQAGHKQLQDVLSYIFSKEGLEQNLDLGLNLTEEGEIPMQIVLANSNVAKLCKNPKDFLEVMVRINYSRL